MLKSMTIGVLAAALLGVGAATSLGADAPVSAREREAALIAVLKSEAGQKEKADACRDLAHLGTRQAVATLVGLLADEKLSHMARYGLETIPDPSVDVAFRAALGTLKGRPLVGVIGSIGVRHDTKAVAALAKHLGDADADVAQGAARALGSIGGAEAVKALMGALADVAPANLSALCEGLFRAAERLAAAGKADEALPIYDRLRTVKELHQVRAGGLRGAILLGGEKGLPLIADALRGDDLVMAAAAVRAAMEMPGAGAAKVLAAELPKLSADKQVLVLGALGQCGDAATLPAILAATAGGEKAVRVAAVHTVARFGDASAAPELVKLMGDAEKDVAGAAQDAVAALPGEKVDAAVAAMLKDPDAKTRRTAVELLGQRRVAGALPDLVKAAGGDEDEAVRMASLKVVGALGGEAQLTSVIDLLAKGKSPGETQAAEAALGAIVARQSKPVTGKVVIVKAVYGALPDGPSADVTAKVAEIVKAGSLAIDASNTNFGDPAQGTPKKLTVEYTVDGRPASATVNENDTLTITAATVAPPACTNALIAAMGKAEGPAKIALLRVLAAGASAKGLDMVRQATKDPAAEVKDAAFRLLCEWPTADALPDLAALARTPPDAKLKILALRGWIRLIPQQDAAPAKQLEALKEAMGMAQRTEEKKLALAALGGIPTADALALVVPHLADADLKEEAVQAAVLIGAKIVDAQPAPVAEAMEKAAAATANGDLAKRAQTLLQKAKAKAGTK